MLPKPKLSRRPSTLEPTPAVNLNAPNPNCRQAKHALGNQPQLSV